MLVSELSKPDLFSLWQEINKENKTRIKVICFTGFLSMKMNKN